MIEAKKIELKNFEDEIKKRMGKRLITITCIPRGMNLNCFTILTTKRSRRYSCF